MIRLRRWMTCAALIVAGSSTAAECRWRRELAMLGCGDLQRLCCRCTFVYCGVACVDCGMLQWVYRSKEEGCKVV